MAGSRRPGSSRDRGRGQRESLRQQGLRPIQVWVPDVRSPEFRAEARRQSLLVTESSRERDDQDFVDSTSDWDDV